MGVDKISAQFKQGLCLRNLWLKDEYSCLISSWAQCLSVLAAPTCDVTTAKIAMGPLETGFITHVLKNFKIKENSRGSNFCKVNIEWRFL